jgi:hypothetical protein
MTKKDFELIASVLNTYLHRRDDNGWETDIVRDMANALRATNKQFNRDKFVRACGVSPSDL